MQDHQVKQEFVFKCSCHSTMIRAFNSSRHDVPRGPPTHMTCSKVNVDCLAGDATGRI